MALERVLSEGVAWCDVLLNVGGCAAGVRYLGRSWWVMLLIWGFGIEAWLGIFYQTVMRILNSQPEDAQVAAGIIFLGGSVVALMGRLAIVGGIVGVLHDAYRASIGRTA